MVCFCKIASERTIELGNDGGNSWAICASYKAVLSSMNKHDASMEMEKENLYV